MDIVALLETLVNGVIEAESDFLKDPKDFYKLERRVKASSDAFAASVLGLILSGIDEQIREDGWRKARYSIHRRDKRTLISTVGAVTFDCTYYADKGKGKGYRHLLEDMIGLEKNERLTECAEAAVLSEALKTSYSIAAKKLPVSSGITKTTVMNKVHGISTKMPESAPEKLRSQKTIYIEADEDHVHEQHGKKTKRTENKGFMSKLVYVYEGKKSKGGKKKLIQTRYFSGIYLGGRENDRLWDEVAGYVYSHYKADEIEKIYITGDGAKWIKEGTEHFEHAEFVADRFHLTKYINSAAGQAGAEKQAAVKAIYRALGGNDKKGFRRCIKSLKGRAEDPDKVDAFKTFVYGNWEAIQTGIRKKDEIGCSAEGHVSHVLSSRLSSRPMGWSRKGADRISRLRCYERNEGEEKIIDLARYSREERRLKKTGTDGAETIGICLRDATKEHLDHARGYIDRLQAEIPGLTARKTFSIRTQLKLI